MKTKQINKQAVIQTTQTQSIKPLCSKCSKELIQAITFKKSLFYYYKVYSFFCCCCDFITTKEIQISKDDYISSMNDRTLKAKNTTFKSYNQNIEVLR